MFKSLILLWFLVVPATGSKQPAEQPIDCSAIQPTADGADAFLDGDEGGDSGPEGSEGPRPSLEPWRGALRELEAPGDARAP